MGLSPSEKMPESAGVSLLATAVTYQQVRQAAHALVITSSCD